MLVDSVEVYIKAGDGGNGSASLLRNGLTAKGGPDGGNGGNGGHIYFQGSHNLTDLKEFRFKKKIIAEDGTPGKHKKLFGKNAPHTTIFVPLGTQITDKNSGSSFEIRNTTVPVLVARGGIGGRGNVEFKSATNQTPRYAENGGIGEEKTLSLELKLIAEIGFIGLPNAGKSSLLTVLTNATPKIGNYPFTTLEPNIGMLGTHPIADIPGLIEGAATGKGLGATFLKHIEKTSFLVHCIESSAENALERYEMVQNEFKAYNEKLLEKPEIILLTKIDLVDEKTLEKNKEMFEKTGKRVLTCSVYYDKTIEALKETLLDHLTK
ncbi:MAG: GTPase ObgE [Patescibacteria group bacterium]